MKWLRAFSHMSLAALACAGVAACQSTGNTNPNNLDPEQVMEAQSVVSQACIVRRGMSSNIKGIDAQSVVVFGIDESKDGWRRVDSKILGDVRMSRGNVYYNLSEKKAYCGQSNWQASGMDEKVTFY